MKLEPKGSNQNHRNIMVDWMCVLAVLASWAAISHHQIEATIREIERITESANQPTQLGMALINSIDRTRPSDKPNELGELSELSELSELGEPESILSPPPGPLP